MVLRPELVLLTLVTGPELTALLQTGVGTFDSGPVLYGTHSSDPYLKQDSQFQPVTGVRGNSSGLSTMEEV